MAASIRAGTPLHAKTATVQRERAAEPGSVRSGEAARAVQSTAKHRLQEAGRRWERIEAACSRKKINEKQCHMGIRTVSLLHKPWKKPVFPSHG